MHRPVPTKLRLLTAALCGALLFTVPPVSQAQEASAKPDIAALSQTIFEDFNKERRSALETLAKLGDKSLIPTLVLAMRWSGDDVDVARALSTLTGTKITTWHEASDWQEAHPEIVPHPSYRPLKLRFWANTDERFSAFFDSPLATREKMKIRFEEIVWGGVLVDGIPSLDKPFMVAANKARYLLDTDLVFGVAINGDVRAYPLRIMGWHEMFNDVIGGVPVALAYCTLCGAGILFETHVEGRKKPFVFGSSGFLYRSNKLMFDRETKSLWNQFTGKPVVGPLVESGIELKVRPVAITSWKDWRTQNPGTTVLSIETGYRRDYGSGVTYRKYFASPDLMFPVRVRDESVVKRKDFVFGIRTVGAAKAWPVEAFRSKSVINDRVGSKAVVLIGDAATRTVRAYERGAETFQAATAGKRRFASGSGAWRLTEDALISDDGRKLPRVPGHISYWFAWDSYLGVKAELYKIN